MQRRTIWGDPQRPPSEVSLRSTPLLFALSIVVPGLMAGCNRGTNKENGIGEQPPVVTTVSSAPSVPAIANSTPAPLPSPRADEGVKTGPLSFAPVAKSADPSVVTIAASGAGPRGRTVRQGLGTGFIVQKDGVIVTNNHVIEDATKIAVQLSDDTVFDATVAGRDPRTDIAVIRVDTQGKDLPAIALGDSDALDVGDWVVAIGNPFGLSHTVSAGIVSGKGRGREDVPLDPSGYYSFIQTDASINPGNSGGPLLNLKGEVIGMNTAIRGGGAQGIGFAIPIDMIKTILPTLLKDGKITRSAIGIKIVDSRALAPEQKTKLKLGEAPGVVVEDVERGGPGDLAKLEAGDLIVAFDGQPVDRTALLQWKASTAGVGKTVNVRVVRHGTTLDLPITLGELKEARRAPPRVEIPKGDIY